MIFYKDILSIEKIPGFDSSLKSRIQGIPFYGTFHVIYKEELPKSYYRASTVSKHPSRRQQYLDRMRWQGYFKKKLFLHVKHHTEFIHILRSIFGDEKWNAIFKDGTTAIDWNRGSAHTFGMPAPMGLPAGYRGDANQYSRDMGSTGMDFDNFFRSASPMTPTKMKRIMKNQKMLFPVYTTYVLYWIYSYMYSALTSRDFDIAETVNMIFIGTLLICAGTFLLGELLSLRWLSRSRIRFEISGDPKLFLRYQSHDLMKTDPVVGYGTLLLTSLPLGFCIFWALDVWTFPEHATFFVFAAVIGMFVILSNVLVERLYLITDQGVAAMKVFKNGLFTLFLPWDAFTGFTAGRNHITFHHREAGLRYGRLFPRRIPVFHSKEQARYIVGHYIPEQ